jgi:hypothetical protein
MKKWLVEEVAGVRAKFSRTQASLMTWVLRLKHLKWKGRWEKCQNLLDQTILKPRRPHITTQKTTRRHNTEDNTTLEPRRPHDITTEDQTTSQPRRAFTEQELNFNPENNGEKMKVL